MATDSFVRMFRQFAVHEFAGSSPVYAALAAACAEQPELAEPLRAAPPRQRRALLLFAAVQHLLRTELPGHALTAYLPVFSGRRAPDADLVATFADLVRTHAAALAERCATRVTQTNEARRAALLRPAFGRAGPTSLALIELGTSAGLLLLPDRYAYHYQGDGRSERFGPPDAPVLLDCEVREGWPVVDEITVADRVGVDLNPIGVDDADAVAWLRSCIWPEHVDRLARLDAALAEARAVGLRLVRGDMLAELPGLVSSVDSAVHPVVFASNALTYLPRGLQLRLAEILAQLGEERDLTVVLNEAASCGVALFASDPPPAPAAQAIAMLTVVSWRRGLTAVEVLGSTGPHGEWLRWTPQSCGYAPPYALAP